VVANAELYKALAKAQTDVENATKGSTNPHLKNRYADLGAVLEVAKPVLSANGLSIVTLPAIGEPGGDARFITSMCHVSGEYVTMDFNIPYGAKRDAQGLGGLLTYARRYCLAAWLNLWAEDDDGETAVGRGGKPAAKPAAPGRPVKELIEALSNAPSMAALDALRPDCGPYRNTEHWPSIEAVAVATKARLEQEAKDAAKKR
jgi:hypothetical protein